MCPSPGPGRAKCSVSPSQRTGNSAAGDSVMSGTRAGCGSLLFPGPQNHLPQVHLLRGASSELRPGRRVRCRGELKTEGTASTREAGRTPRGCHQHTEMCLSAHPHALHRRG